MAFKRGLYQKIRNDHLYTRKELAELLGLLPSTISKWVNIKNLEVLRMGKRNWLFEGFEVKIFLKKWSKSRKVKLLPGQMYCASCKAGRRAIPESICVHDTGMKLGKGNVTKLRITGQCECCGCKMNLFTSSARIQEFLREYPEIEKK